MLRNRHRIRSTRTLARQRPPYHEDVPHDSALANGELDGRTVGTVRENRLAIRRLVRRLTVGAAVTRVAAALTRLPGPSCETIVQ
jgi:hypothetical protein